MATTVLFTEPEELLPRHQAYYALVYCAEAAPLTLLCWLHNPLMLITVAVAVAIALFL
jgi:hypothetical protein